MELLLELLWTLFPVLLVMLLLYVIVFRNQVVWKLIIFIISFVYIETMLLRKQLWLFHGDYRKLQIEFISDGWLLFTLSLIGLLIFVGCILFQVQLNRYVLWTGKSIFKSFLYGLIGTIILIIPILIYNRQMSAEFSFEGNLSLFISTILFILVGKSIEELIFRGYLQGYFERIFTPLKAGVIAIAIYSILNFIVLIIIEEHHWLILLQIIYIGIICSGLRYRYGILASSLANVLTIVFWYIFS